MALHWTSDGTICRVLKHANQGEHAGGLGMGRRYLLLLCVPLLLLTVSFTTGAVSATSTTPAGLTAWPTFGGTSGEVTTPDCGTISPKSGTMTCWVTLGEPATANESLHWYASEPAAPNVIFVPSNGTISPGQHVKVLIERQPCLDQGEWDFTGLDSSASLAFGVAVPNLCG